MDGIACMAKYVYVCTYNLYNTISKGTHTFCLFLIYKMYHLRTFHTNSFVYIYVCNISRYHGKCGISLWVIRYIPQFELAVRHLGINHYCSLSLMSSHFSCLPISHS